MDRYQLIKQIVSNIENGIFVEIGTDKGDLTEYILENSVNSIIYCIDPYEKYEEYEDAINNVTGDDLYHNIYNKLKNKYGDRYIPIRKRSNFAINDIPNNIDFLYIDGNHSCKYVYNDLQLYYPKVKIGRYIVGDDAVDINDNMRDANGDVYIEWFPGCYGKYGVIKAFNTFIFEQKLTGKIVGTQYIIKKENNNIYFTI